jgi:ABC-type transporter Mla MlaB component
VGLLEITFLPLRQKGEREPLNLMTLSTENVNGTVNLSGMLNIDGASSLREALLQSFLLPGDISVNLSALEGCDTAGLQILLAAQKHAEAISRSFQLEAPPDSVKALAAALGVTLPGA